MRSLFFGLVLGAGFGTATVAIGAPPSGPASLASSEVREARAESARNDRERTGRVQRSATARASSPSAAAAPKSGIAFVGANTWEVPESIVDRYVSDPSALSGQAGATQVPNGWKLTSVKSGSRVAQMGLQSGDVITSVNGYGLGSLTATWWASTHLKNKELYDVSIKRGGQSQTLKYKVI